MRVLRLAGVLGVAATMLAAANPLTASAAESALRAQTFSGQCPILTASKWVAPVSSNTTGTKYRVTVSNYSCAQADRYITKLVTHKVSHAIPYRVKGGPHGWVCTGSPSKTGVAITGTCGPLHAGFTGGPRFTWTWQE